jgi:polyisoprenyl-phosphate glycosyltransferase
MENNSSNKYTKKVTVVIPAYNESGRIGKVLSVLRETDCINEIIVIDDGSQDETLDEARHAASLDLRVRVISHSINKGKGQAILTGVQEAQSPYLLFLDADLVNLNPNHISALIEPVTSGKADMTLGLFRGGRINTDFAHWVNPSLTGQRCLRADLMQNLSREASNGYGIEIAITIAAYNEHYRVKLIMLHGVWHPPSEFHRGLVKGIRWRMKMYREILHAWKVSGGTEALTERLIEEPINNARQSLNKRYRKVKRRAYSLINR